MSSIRSARAAMTAYPMETDIDKSMQIIGARIIFQQGYKIAEDDILELIERLRFECGDLNIAAQCGYQIALDKVADFIKEVVL